MVEIIKSMKPVQARPHRRLTSRRRVLGGMWRCSADSNAELVANLEAGGIIRTPAVRSAMLATDRGDFVPDPPPSKKKRSST